MSLNNKIDFAVIFNVKNANPNGDPLNSNRPRTTYENYGEMSDVCIKRKIRNRLLEMKKDIFVQSDDNRVDEYGSLKARADAFLPSVIKPKDLIQKACEKWFDVRAFGQLFAFKAKGGSKGKDTENSGDDKGVSIGIRGPVSIQSAFSIAPVSITSSQITKSVSSEGDGKTRGSDTMGMKHRVDQGTYIFFGSMNPQLAVKTGFSDEDAEVIKSILPRLFENDESAARPSGSMEVLKVIWWHHNCPSGQTSSAKVHRSLHLSTKGDFTVDLSFDKVGGPNPEVIEGY
jgi:CRISPR-associated protein Csd2